MDMMQLIALNNSIHTASFYFPLSHIFLCWMMITVLVAPRPSILFTRKKTNEYIHNWRKKTRCMKSLLCFPFFLQKKGYVSFFLLLAFPHIACASPVVILENQQKPYQAIDIEVQIPAEFNRYSSNSYLTIQDLSSPNRYLAVTPKDLIPGEIYTTTIGGFSPSSSYEVEIALVNDGYESFTELKQFSTRSEPMSHRKTVLMVIDDDLQSAELVHEYSLYTQSIIEQEGNVDVEQYYIGEGYSEKIELYEYIQASFFNKNLSSIFFIGKNSSFPVEIYLLDDQGKEVYQFQYEGLSFYSHIWNNPYQFIPEKNRYAIIQGLNASSTPNLYSSYFSNSSVAEISFGAFVPTTTEIGEKKNQVRRYLKKIRDYRKGLFSFNKSVLYSDTMWGNESVERDLSFLPSYSNNTAIHTTHTPDHDFHLSDEDWKEEYLSKLEQQSYEIAWVNVHGAPTYHYFGVSNFDIENLSRLNTAYVSLQSCNTGNFNTPGYLAGTYLNTGNVLVVEANMYPTMYIGNNATPFSEFFNLYAVANGKKVGDAMRQHGSMHIGHILYGDPMLTIGEQKSNTLPKPKSEFWSLFLPIILENAKRGSIAGSAGK